MYHNTNIPVGCYLLFRNAAQKDRRSRKWNGKERKTDRSWWVSVDANHESEYLSHNTVVSCNIICTYIKLQYMLIPTETQLAWFFIRIQNGTNNGKSSKTTMLWWMVSSSSIPFLFPHPSLLSARGMLTTHYQNRCSWPMSFTFRSVFIENEVWWKRQCGDSGNQSGDWQTDRCLQ